MPTVLVSHLYEPTYTDDAFARYPDLEFVRLEKNAPPPEAATRAQVLLYGGMEKSALSALIRAAPQLEWIHTGTAGFDWVMVPEIEARGIRVSRSAGVMNIPMAEFAFAAMLEHAKNLARLRDAQREHRWAPPMHAELHGATLAVIGAGAIGERLARIAGGFDMRVVGMQRNPRSLPGFASMHGPKELHSVLAQADFVVLTCPLTPETRGMMDAGAFAVMKPTAYLLNLARGGLIVDADLLRALETHQIAGACLDAFEVEPLPADHPFWNAPNLLLSPHCSYRSPMIRHRVVAEFTANLERYLNGQPLENTMKHATLGY